MTATCQFIFHSLATPLKSDQELTGGEAVVIITAQCVSEA
jgi:hypothetical protein